MRRVIRCRSRRLEVSPNSPLPFDSWLEGEGQSILKAVTYGRMALFRNLAVYIPGDKDRYLCVCVWREAECTTL